MGTRILQRGFAGGEIAPSLLARTDLPHYKMGASKVDNFVVLPQGAIRKRSGFSFLGNALNPYKPVRLIPFRYSSTQTFCLEFGDYTMRVITFGAYVLDNNDNVLTVTTPYSAENLKYLDYSQNADIVTITSNLYPPYELRRYSNTDWRFVKTSLNPTISAPSGVTVTPVYANSMTSAESATKDKLNVTYVVTAFDSEERESISSAQASGKGNYYIHGAKIRVSWNAVSGAIRYRVYRAVSGIFGYIGETESLYLEDEGLNPDTTITPPRYKQLFSDSSNAITSVSVLTGGSGYAYGQEGAVTYIPRGLSLDAIPPYISEGYDTQAEADAWSISNPSLLFIDSVLNRTELTISVPVDYVTKQIDNKYYRVAYLKEQLGMNLTSNKRGIGNLLIRFAHKTSGVSQGWIADEQPRFLENNEIFSRFDEGITLEEYLEIFPQDTICQMPLTVSDAVGVNADIDAVAEDGVIISVIVNNKGINYSPSTVVELNNSVGSGATFKVNTTGNSLPDYPSACTQYDQRRVFAGSTPHPLKCWFTNSGQQDIMQYHIPVLDDDRIEIEAVTADADRIKHLVALESLLMFTSTSELRVYTQNSDALTPKSVAVRAQSYVGANDVQPVIVNATVVYASSRGGHVRALGYDYSQQGYITQDISIRAPHLFDNYDIVSMCLQKSPIQIVWCVSSNGALYSCTFFPDQNLIAWAQHHTVGGKFESVCTISEDEEDHLYAVILRDGVRRIERLDNLKEEQDTTDHHYLDSYLAGSFETATRRVTGLNHLEGKTVAVFADGKQQSQKVVTNGAITLDEPAYEVAVGLPLTSTLITLPLLYDTEAELQGRTKNITEAYLRVSHEGVVKVGNYPNGNLYVCKRDDIYMKPQQSESYIVKVTVDGSWTEQAQLQVVSDDTFPLEIQSLIKNISYEDGK